MADTRDPTVLVTSRNNRQWLVGVGIALLIVGGIALPIWWCYAFSRAMHDVFTGKTGPVTSRSEWPRPLKEVLDDLGEVEIDESTILVHGLCDGAYDSEFVWRMDAAPGLFELLEERWTLAPVSASDWYVLKGYQSSMTHERAPAWWVPEDDDQTSFYISPRGYDNCGDRFRVGLDENRNTIWVHFRYRF